MADSFQKFMDQALQPGVLRHGRRRVDVRRLAQISPGLLKDMDDAVNDDLQRLEAEICMVDSRDQKKAKCFDVARPAPRPSLDRWETAPTAEVLWVLANVLSPVEMEEPMECRLRLARALVASLRERRVRAEQRGQDWQ